MLRRRVRLTIAMAYTSMMLLTTSVYGQSSTTPPPSRGNDVASAQGPRLSNPDKKADGSRASDLENDIAEVKAENAAVREQLRKMEEQQKTLLELVDGLQRKLDGFALANVTSTAPAPSAAQPGESGVASASAANASAAAPVSPPMQNDPKDDRYQDGIILWQTPDDAKIPFLIRFNQNTQIRYLNTLDSPETYIDHLGGVRNVLRRNDITVNRTMFILGGYIFDKRLKYSSTVWTSAGAASIVVAGNIGWQFSKALTIMGGYNGVPGSRSLVNSFPYFTSTDRSMADNFFRPGFTQGLWANGEPVKGLNYMVFVGNGLNTINITANKIDTSLLLSGSVWWEPLGDYAPAGKSRNMYDDYYAVKKTRIRIGTSFTRSREDRFSNLDTSSPENTSLYNSDGVLTFSTGAFAPGVTVDKATYRMWAIDGGLKKSGLALNGQYYFRWINDFEANGPLPLTSTFDHGGEFSASYFAIPKELMVYARGSKVWGQFGNSWEYAGGVKWHFLPTERLWLNAELMRVHKVPYTGAFTPYNSGINGWTPMIQTVLAF